MLAFFRSPRMKAAFAMCGGLLLLQTSLLPLPSGVAATWIGIASAIAAYGYHGTLWVFEASDAPEAPFLVRGLPETVSELGEKYGVRVSHARASNRSWSNYLPVPRLVAGVQFQMDYDLLEEPRPQIRYVIALAFATTAIHRRIR